MAIKSLQFENGRTLSIPLAVSQTVGRGDGLVWSSGFLALAAASEEIVDYVAEEAITTDGSSNTPILVRPCSQSRIRYEIDTDANTAATDRGQAFEMKDKNTLDNATTATANGFLVDEVVGAAANKVVRGFFL